MPRIVSRRGFTLVELLVVMAIIAILVGLLLPAVQKIRESSNRSKCQNNLKQMGVALHMYHDTVGNFPQGYGNTTADLSGWGWGALILPYLEQQGLYSQLNVAGGNDTIPTSPTTPNTLGATKLVVYRCPSDQGSDTNSSRGNFGTSNYAGVNSSESTYLDGVTADPPGANGTLFCNSKIKMAQVTDGLSNTVVVGERGYDNGIKRNGAVWIGRTKGYGHASTCQNLNGSSTGANSITLNGQNAYAFSSYHGGYVGFVFGDGSVRHLSEKTSPSAQTNYAGRNDGNVIANDW